MSSWPLCLLFFLNCFKLYYFFASDILKTRFLFYKYIFFRISHSSSSFFFFCFIGNWIHKEFLSFYFFCWIKFIILELIIRNAYHISNCFSYIFMSFSWNARKINVTFHFMYQAYVSIWNFYYLHSILNGHFLFYMII